MEWLWLTAAPAAACAGMCLLGAALAAIGLRRRGSEAARSDDARPHELADR